MINDVSPPMFECLLSVGGNRRDFPERNLGVLRTTGLATITSRHCSERVRRGSLLSFLFVAVLIYRSSQLRARRNMAPAVNIGTVHRHQSRRAATSPDSDTRSPTSMDTQVATEITCQPVRATKTVPSLTDDVLAGLFAAHKQLPAKYFYDDRGSALFDQICDEPEYYPTRTEDALLERSARDIITRVSPTQIIEFGSGMSRKIRHLFDACSVLECYPTYIPFDVCDDVMIKSGHQLAEQYRWLDVAPLSGDYTAGLGNVPLADGQNLLMFLGGTIGNFAPEQAVAFLREMRELMGARDQLLIGADRVKQPDVLHAAYNDVAGVTAEFNLNLLEVLNRELGADFQRPHFEHYACYDPDAAQIEMYLVCMRDQAVRFEKLNRTLELKEGDAIRTEISRKFTRETLETLLIEAGFGVKTHYEAAAHPFSLVLAAPA
jgi:L-histidine N-alpha-methyltransferase